MNEREREEAQRNRAIRGYIVRCLIKGSRNSAITKHIANALLIEGLILSPDISKYLDYLIDGGYVEFSDKKFSTFATFAEDAVVRLTNKGVNLAEGAITDPGVEI